MLIIYLWAYVIDEFRYRAETLIELFWSLVIGIFFTVPALMLDIVFSPIEIITLIIYKILKRRYR